MSALFSFFLLNSNCEFTVVQSNKHSLLCQNKCQGWGGGFCFNVGVTPALESCHCAEKAVLASKCSVRCCCSVNGAVHKTLGGKRFHKGTLRH